MNTVQGRFDQRFDVTLNIDPRDGRLLLTPEGRFVKAA
jgi:hypothetical protein